MVSAAHLIHRNVGVDLGRIEPRVAEQSLDRAQIRPVIQHVCRAGMPEEMWSSPCDHPCRRQIAPNHVAP